VEFFEFIEFVALVRGGGFFGIATLDFIGMRNDRLNIPVKAEGKRARIASLPLHFAQGFGSQ